MGLPLPAACTQVLDPSSLVWGQILLLQGRQPLMASLQQQLPGGQAHPLEAPEYDF